MLIERMLSPTRGQRLVALAAAICCFPLVASAGNNDVLTINATVLGVCVFQSTTGTITVANSGASIDPSSATTATGTGSIVYNCTKGQVPVFNYANGADVPSTTAPTSIQLNCSIASCPAGADRMNAALTWTLPASTTGAGFSAAGNKTITLAPSIAQAVFQDKTLGGPYTNTVTIFVTP